MTVADLSLPNSKDGANVKMITMKTMKMAMAIATIVVMENHELEKKIQEEKGQIEMFFLRRFTHVKKMFEEIRA